MIKAATYLFASHHFGPDHIPQLCLLPENAQQFYYLQPRGQVLTITFDTSQRYCTGWYDLATENSHPCPDMALLPSQYKECRHCQQKTGFNPAFYHAQTVSRQQADRNAQPHSLYLAHFGANTIKVGMTLAQRGIRRLLDQGARSGLTIKTFPTADIARQYEAAIAKLPGLVEMVQIRQKQTLLKRPYNEMQAAAEMQASEALVCQKTNITPGKNSPQHFDSFYFDQNTLTPNKIIDSNPSFISGRCIGMAGSTLFCQQDGLQFKLPLSKLAGYKATISDLEKPNSTTPQQISLF